MYIERPICFISLRQANNRLFRHTVHLSTALLLLLLVSLGGFACQALAQETSPNIIIIMTDDQAIKTIRFMPTVRSELAAKGITFDNAFAAQPLCCPNRASFLTGRYPHNHGITGNSGAETWNTPLDHHMIPVWMRAAGYETAYFGKYLNGYEDVSYIPPGWQR